MSYLLYHINPDLLKQDIQKYASSLDKFLYNIIWRPYNQYKGQRERLKKDFEENSESLSKSQSIETYNFVNNEDKSMNNIEHLASDVNQLEKIENTANSIETQNQIQTESIDLSKQKDIQNNGDSVVERSEVEGLSNLNTIFNSSPNPNTEKHDEITLAYYQKSIQDLEMKKNIIFEILFNALKITDQMKIESIRKVFSEDEDAELFLKFLASEKSEPLLLKRWFLMKGKIDLVLKDYNGVEKETAFYLLSISRILEAKKIFEEIKDLLWVDNCNWILGKKATNPIRKLIYYSEICNWNQVLQILESSELNSILNWSLWNMSDKEISNYLSDSESLRYNVWIHYILSHGEIDLVALRILSSNLVWSFLNSRMHWIVSHADDRRLNAFKYLFQDSIVTSMLTSEPLAIHCLCKLFNASKQLRLNLSPNISKLIENLKDVIYFLVDYYKYDKTIIFVFKYLNKSLTVDSIPLFSIDKINIFNGKQFNLQNFINNKTLNPLYPLDIVNASLEDLNNINSEYENNLENEKRKRRKLGINSLIRDRLKFNHKIISTNYIKDSNQTFNIIQNETISKYHVEFFDYLSREMIFRERHINAKKLIEYRNSTIFSNFEDYSENLSIENLLCKLNDLFLNYTVKFSNYPWNIDIAFQPFHIDTNIFEEIITSFSTSDLNYSLLSELTKHLFNLNDWKCIHNVFTNFQKKINEFININSNNNSIKASNNCSFALRLCSIIESVQAYSTGNQNYHLLINEIDLFCNGLLITEKRIVPQEDNSQYNTYKMVVVGAHWDHINILTSCKNTHLKKLVISLICYYLYSLRSLKKQPTNLFRNLAEVFLKKEELYMPSVMNIFYQQDNSGEEEISILDSILCDILRYLLQSLKEQRNSKSIDSKNFPLPIYLYILTLADVHFERKSYTCALKYYLMACSHSSNHFTNSVPDDVLSPETIKRMIHTLRLQRKFTESAVMCQFLSLGYDQSFIQDLKRFNMKWSQYFWDESFLELLLYIAHYNQDHERENILLKFLERGEMNIHNPIDRTSAFIEKLKGTFFSEIYRETWYGGFE